MRALAALEAQTPITTATRGTPVGNGKWSPTSGQRTEPRGALALTTPSCPAPEHSPHLQFPPLAHEQVAGPPSFPQDDHHLSESLCSLFQIGKALEKERGKEGGVPQVWEMSCSRPQVTQLLRGPEDGGPRGAPCRRGPQPSPSEAELAPKCQGPLPVPAGPDSASWSAWQSCPPCCALGAAGTEPWEGFRGGAKGHNPGAGTGQQGNKKLLRDGGRLNLQPISCRGCGSAA